MRRSGALPAPRVEMMRGFLPGTNPLPPDDQPVTPDEMLRSEGWRLHLVEAGFSLQDDDGAHTVVRTVSVVPLWLRQEGSRTMAFLHGHPSICSDVVLENDAVEGVLSLMYGHHCRFAADRGGASTPELQSLRDYLRGIFTEET